ncbi:MAG: FTR1 family iron permease [Patescibacteria group bacterium]
MFTSLIIGLRETLEAALVVGIVIGYLNRTGQSRYIRMAWMGVGIGTALSIIGAIAFDRLAGGFEGTAEALYEGIAMITGAILITTLIFWMMRRQQLMAEIHADLDRHITNAHPMGIFWVVLVAILREGIEMAIFLGSARMIDPDHSFIGALIGIIIAISIGYGLYRGFLRINLTRFFAITGIMLMLFAAGLLAHGIHELQEAGAISFWSHQVWDINPSVTETGVYPPLHENGYLGSIIKGLFGYNGNPTLLEVSAYLLYLSVITVLWWRMFSRNSTQNARQT